METFLVGIILISVLIQGGFYPTISLGSACILSCFSLFSPMRKYDCYEWILWGWAGLYLLASLANGYASESLGQACLPGACALFLSLYRGIPTEKKDRLLRIILLSGGLFAGIAILAYCGIIPLNGAVVSHRLQFTFQYANAAGSWFAALALLAQDSRNSDVRHLSLPLITAMCLTRSVGALGLYIILQLVRLWQRRRESLWPETVLIHTVSMGFAAVFYFATGWIAAALLVLLYVAGWYWDTLFLIGRRLRLPWIALLAGCAGTIALLFSQRFSSSLRTFAERLIQIWDGLCIIATYPLLGVGAGNWEGIYPYYQSAQYTSAVVHSGIIQIGVDAGVFAIILAIIFFVLAWRRKGRSPSESLAACLLALHSILDFTMQFFPIDALLLSLLFAGEEPAAAREDKKAPCCSVFLVFGALCAVLLYGQMQYKQIVYSAQAQEWDSIQKSYERQQPLFGRSPAVRNIYVQALYNSGNLRRVVEVTEAIPNPRAEELLLRAQALQRLGRTDDACRLLLEQLERQLCRVGLFERVAQLLLEWGADRHFLEAYNQIVDEANNRQTALGAWKGDQVYIDKILLRE